MEQRIDHRKVAILVANGFEESEFIEPLRALKRAGADVQVISLKTGTVKAWKDKNWSREYQVDKIVSQVHVDDYDALVLPGGVMNPDQLRIDKNVVEFVTQFIDSGKPIAAICHGPWTLIETHKLKGRKMTSWPSLRTDLENAGVEWVDEEVVVDNGLVTSRMPNDLPAFCTKMIEEIAEGIHA